MAHRLSFPSRRRSLRVRLSLRVCITLSLVPVVCAQTPTWGKRTPTAQPVGGHALGIAYDAGAGQTIVFGSGQKSETWSWDGKQTWKLVATTGPSGRSYRDMVYDSKRKRIVMVAGSSDTWEWDGAKWTQIFPAVKPKVTNGYKLAFDSVRGVTVLFGGYYSSWTMADTWEYDGKTWRQRSSGGPPHRIDHAMVFDESRGEVVLFGGMGIRNSNDAYYFDTWVWNGIYWREHFGIPGPGHRRYAAMTYDPRRKTTILYGGSAYNDTWEWDGVSWSKITTLGNPTIGGAKLAFDVTRDVAVLIGGTSSSSETWEYSNQGGVKATFSTFGTGCAGSAGVPILAAGTGQLPRIGQSFTMQFRQLPSSPFARVMGIAGASSSSWNKIPLPLGLGPIGMPKCTLFTSWDLPLQSLSIANGTATWTIPIPNNAALNGGLFYVQGMLLEPGVNTFGAVMSNAGAGRLGS